MKKRSSLLLGTFTILLAFPVTALGYLNPYDVLLSDDLLLPASARESVDRVDRQQRESAARRAREQEALFAEQFPAMHEESTVNLADAGIDDETLYGAAPELGNGNDAYPQYPDETLYTGDEYLDRETLTLLRALDRIKQNQADARLEQEVLSLLSTVSAESVHSGAPLPPHIPKPLPETGAGTLATVVLMILALGWTLRRARISERYTEV